MKFRSDNDPGGLLSPRRKSGDGALMVEGRVARPGIYEYYEDGDVVRELVPRSTLYEPDSLASLGRVAYTDGHPPEPVNENNADKYQDGDVGDEVHIGGNEFVRVTATIRTNEAIRNALSGKRDQLSPGYHAEIRDQAGEHPEFGEFDRIQTKRVYNHLAGVGRARGGGNCNMRTDDADFEGPGARLFLENHEISWKEDESEVDWKIDQDLEGFENIDSNENGDMDTDDDSNSDPDSRGDSAMQLEDLMDKMDDIEDKLDGPTEGDTPEDGEPEDDSSLEDEFSEFVSDAKDAIEELSEENEKLREKATKMEAKLEGMTEKSDDDQEEDGDDVEFSFDSKEELLEWQNEREALKSVAEKYDVGLEETMDNIEMKRAIVEEELDKDLEGAEDIRVDGLYEGLTERTDLSNRNYDTASDQSASAFENTGKSGRQKAKEDFNERWKNGEE